MPNAKIPFRNINYLRTTKEPLKPHLIAELFDDVDRAFGQLGVQTASAATVSAPTVIASAGSTSPGAQGPQGPQGQQGNQGASGGGGSGTSFENVFLLMGG